jgi:hypothetical protein
MLILLNQNYIPFSPNMNYNLDCIFIKKKLSKKPFAGKDTKEVQMKYICIHKKDFMGDNGCPQPNRCKGYKPAGIWSIS